MCLLPCASFCACATDASHIVRALLHAHQLHLMCCSDRPVELLRREATNASLSAAGLRFCEFDMPHQDGVESVPEAGCIPAGVTLDAVSGHDFMSGGDKRLEGQAIVDISARFVGGYIYGNVCGLGGGQDERLMVYMPEVAALAFFLSEAPSRDEIGERPQLRVPAWILGARMLFRGATHRSVRALQ